MASSPIAALATVSPPLPNNDDDYSVYYDTSSPAADDSGAGNINGKIAVASIIVFLLAMSTFFTLHLLAKLLYRRFFQDRRRGEGGGFVTRGGAAVTVQLHDSIDPEQHRPQGLDKVSMRLLPTFNHHSKNLIPHEYSPLSTECSVCLSEFEDHEMLRLLPACRHLFHADCIDMWFFSHSTCPLCRTSAAAAALPPLSPDLAASDSGEHQSDTTLQLADHQSTPDPSTVIDILQLLNIYGSASASASSPAAAAVDNFDSHHLAPPTMDPNYAAPLDPAAYAAPCSVTSLCDPATSAPTPPYPSGHSSGTDVNAWWQEYYWKSSSGAGQRLQQKKPNRMNRSISSCGRQKPHITIQIPPPPPSPSMVLPESLSTSTPKPSSVPSTPSLALRWGRTTSPCCGRGVKEQGGEEGGNVNGSGFSPNSAIRSCALVRNSMKLKRMLSSSSREALTTLTWNGSPSQKDQQA